MEGFGLPLAKRWSVDLSNNVSHPLIANGRIFVTVADNSSRVKRVVALDSATGSILWQQQLGGYYWRVELAYENETVFTVTTDGVMQAWDAATGALKWQSQMPGQYAFSTCPTAVNGIVYVGGAGSGGTVYAVSEANGTIIWTQSVENGDDSSPVVVNGSLFVSYSGPQTYCFNAANGAAVWHYDSGIEGGGGKTLAYYNGRLYDRVTHSGIVFDAAAGKRLNLAFDYGPIPAFDAGRMYLVSGGVLFAKDASTMSQIWSQVGNGGFTIAPVVINGIVFAGTDRGDIYGFDGATGTLLWHDNPGGGPILAPDEQNVASVLVGLGAGEGSLLVPSGHLLTAYSLTGTPSPLAPSNLTATLDGSQISLSWTDNSSIETGFKIQRKSGAAPFATISTVAANVVTFSDQGLQPNTTYTYQVIATNGGVDSAPSNSAAATTPRNPPNPPANLLATASSGSRIDLQWTDASTDEDGFEVERAVGSGTFSPIGAVGPNATAYSDTTVAAETTYTYRVRATAGGSASGYAVSAPVTTPASPLVPPSNFTAVLAGGQVTLSWTDNSSNEDSFLIDRAAGNNPFVLYKVVGTNVTSYVDANLAPDTTYTYRVRANRGTVASDPSNTASITTPPPAPAAPANLTATAAGQTEIDLSWTDASPNEDGFHIERSTDGATFAPLGSRAANQTTYADTGLTPGTTYFYRVRAFNVSGESIASNTARATTAPIAPDLPSGLQVTGRTQTSITLGWTAGTGAASYEVERGDGVTFSRIGTPTAAAYTDGGLQPNTSYVYRVRAVNVGGVSGYTANVTGTTLPDPPPAPGGLQANPSSSTAVRVTWSAPSGPVTGYRLERSGDGGISWTPLGPVSASDTGFLDAGLQPGTTYQYRLRASNTGGDGPLAGPVSATTLTPTSPPAPPQNLRTAGMTASAIQLAWNASSGAVSYVVERKGATGEFGVLGTVGGTAFTDTGVTAGVTYSYRVKAVNAGGESGYSSTLAVTISTGGKLKLSTTALSFGRVVHGKTVQKTLTLTNTGRGLLVVNVGTVDAPFNVALGTGSYTLRPKQRQKVTVRFAPTGTAAYSRSLIVTSTDPAEASVSVRLTGSGR